MSASIKHRKSENIPNKNGQQRKDKWQSSPRVLCYLNKIFTLQNSGVNHLVRIALTRNVGKHAYSLPLLTCGILISIKTFNLLKSGFSGNSARTSLIPSVAFPPTIAQDPAPLNYLKKLCIMSCWQNRK